MYLMFVMNEGSLALRIINKCIQHIIPAIFLLHMCIFNNLMFILGACG